MSPHVIFVIWFGYISLLLHRRESETVCDYYLPSRQPEGVPGRRQFLHFISQFFTFLFITQLEPWAIAKHWNSLLSALYQAFFQILVRLFRGHTLEAAMGARNREETKKEPSEE
jgi:hypothetical protein